MRELDLKVIALSGDIFIKTKKIKIKIDEMVWMIKYKRNFSDLVCVKTEKIIINEYVDISKMIQIKIIDLEHINRGGAVIIIIMKRLDLIKFFIYKKVYYQRGMSPLAYISLSYLIFKFYVIKIVNF